MLGLEPDDDKAIAAAINAGDQIERELQAKPDGRSISTFLAAAREDSIEAMKALIDTNPFDMRQVMLLQNEARRYRDLRAWIGETMSRANEAWNQLNEKDRAEARAFLDATAPQQGPDDT